MNDKGLLILYPSKINLIYMMIVVGVLSILGNLIFYSEFGEAQFKYVLGILTALIVYYLLKLTSGRSPTDAVYFECKEKRWIVAFFEILSVIGFVISIILMKTYGFRGNLDFFDNLRHAKTADNLNYYGTGHLGLMALVLSVYFKIKLSFIKSYFYLIVALFSSLVAAERTGILYMAIIYFGFDCISRQRVRLFSYIFIFIIVSALFYLIALQTNKLYDSSGVLFVVAYFSYPLEALNSLNLDHVVLSFSSVIGLFGLPLDFFIAAPVSSPDDAGLFNVYSYVYKPLVVFGSLGFFVVMGLVGVFLHILEFVAGKSIVGAMAKLSFAFSVVMMFYDWTFHYYTHLYLIVFSFVLFGKYRFK